MSRSVGESLVLALVLPATIGVLPLGAQPSNQKVPAPATENMEPQVASLLEATWTELTSLLAANSALPAVERVAAVGEACEIFQAHGSVESATACYRQVIDLDPESARWPYLLGTMLKNQGRTQESLELLHASQDRQASPLTLFRIGEVLVADGQIDQARAVLEPLAGSEGLEAAVAAELGKMALLEGDAARAVDRLTAALELQPDALSLHFPLAQALRILADTSAAEKHSSLAGQRQVRVADPILQQVGERSVSSETYVTMGAQALRAGDRTTAVGAYNKAIQLNPENKRAWMNLGVLAKEEGRLDEAEEALLRALAIDREYGFAHFNLAEVLSQTDRLDDAIEHYQTAVDANPKNVEFGLGLAAALTRSGANVGAAEQYARVAALAPDFARPHYLQSLALAAMGDLDAAADAAAAARQQDAQDEDIARAFIRLASTAPGDDGERRKGALEAARDLFARHRSTDEGELLAMALAANGRFEEAAALQSEVLDTLAEAGVEEEVMAYLRDNLASYESGERAGAPWPGGG